MHRIFLDFLKNRGTRARQTPLLVRGARQCGKSYAIREYARHNYQHTAEVNLELNPTVAHCFTSLNAPQICRELESVLNITVTPGKTLLFIDEIQASREALLSLRAFKEQLPQLEVIAAGSLLEFALDDTMLRSFPVGRVGFAWLFPMSFKEFLLAMGESRAIEVMSVASLRKPSASMPISPALHQKLLGLVRVYFLIGGMPEVVDVYRETKSFAEVKRIQTNLTQGYIADFVKYGARYDHRKLQNILQSIPRLVGKGFKYSQLDMHARARDLKKPLEDLEKAGLIHIVRASSANGVPLGAEERDNKFKVQFLDIGLMLHMLGTSLMTEAVEEALFANEGALAEQFVGQEILANAPPDVPQRLYYWARETKGSEAEVDFVIADDDRIVPIEVKAGTTGRLKSLLRFLDEKQSPFGVRISHHPLSQSENILSVPLYMCHELQRLITEARL